MNDFKRAGIPARTYRLCYQTRFPKRNKIQDIKGPNLHYPSRPECQARETAWIASDTDGHHC